MHGKPFLPPPEAKEEPKEESEDYELAVIVHVANAMAHGIGCNMYRSEAMPPTKNDYLDLLHLPSEKISLIVEQVSDDFQDMDRLEKN